MARVHPIDVSKATEVASERNSHPVSATMILIDRSRLSDPDPWAINEKTAKVRQVGREHHSLMRISGVSSDDGVDAGWLLREPARSTPNRI
jgi:hypothetical protein